LTYNLIQPPFKLKQPREISQKERERYFQWFMEVLPQRTDELAQAVRQSPGFEAWQPDLTPGSLDALGDWFAGQIEIRTRKRTEAEIQAILSDEQLTTRTLSLAMDVGMYFSRVLLKSYGSLRWVQPVDKQFVDYGQPVLAGVGPLSLNPVRVARVLARRVATKAETGKRLRELYAIWAHQLQLTSPDKPSAQSHMP
jgi:hypothetical protein